jgi:uncharacterized repeat protein (TIGR03803 family)
MPALLAVLNLIPAGRVRAQTFTTLYSFTATYKPNFTNGDGAFPYAGLIANSSGNTLYGAAAHAGISGNGTVFAVNTDGSGFTNLHSFTAIDLTYLTNTDGALPVARLILSGNTLYGTAYVGGSSDAGTVFKVNTDGSGFTNLHSFSGSSDGDDPRVGLLLSGSTLYGADDGGSSGNGTVFVLNTDGTGFTNLHRFNYSDGVNPRGELILSNATLYGTAAGGGSWGWGTVFKVNTDGSGFTNLHNFTYNDGASPVGQLVLSGSTLYGNANVGGSSGNGTVFAVNTDGSDFTNLHSFTSTHTNSSGVFTNNDGANSQAGLILSGNILYGTAAQGGSQGAGAVFALKTDGTGFTNLHSFAVAPYPYYINSEGANPQAGLILSGNTLYGTASSGGSSGNGTVFSLSFRPQLSIVHSGPNVILSWPTNVAGFDYTCYTLQSTTNLVSPLVWSTNSPAPVVIGGQNTVTNPITGAQQFYRLVQ